MLYNVMYWNIINIIKSFNVKETWGHLLYITLKCSISSFWFYRTPLERRILTLGVSDAADHSGARTIQVPGVNLSDGTRTRLRSHPTWMQHKLLRWSMATEEQHPTAEPVHLTHTYLHTPHTLRHRSWIKHRGRIHTSRWEISLSRWPSGSPPPGSESGSTSAPGASRQDPHLGPLKNGRILNRQDGNS